MGEESNRTLARQQALRDQIPPSTVAGLLRMAGRSLDAAEPGGTEATDEPAEAAGAQPAEATGAQPAEATGTQPAEPGPIKTTGPRPARPSWPQVIGTTTRLWVRRHLLSTTRHSTPGTTQHSAPRAERHSTSSAEFVRTGERQIAPRRQLMIGLIVLAAAILVASGLLIIAIPRHTPAPAPAGAGAGAGTGALGAITNVRRETAAWVARQVSPSAIVACDPVMCTALQAQGLAPQNLLTLQPAASDPLGSDVVVATAAVRSQFGSRLASVYAPTVIASFGSGAARIDVRAVAADGAAAYEAALTSDRLARRAAGAQLLGNRRITAVPAAARELAGGQVDSRLLIMLAAIAARYPMHIVAFGAPAPGASPDVPLLTVDVTGTTAQSAAELRQVQTLLRAQLPPYHPLHVQVLAPAGQTTLRIDFGAPSPLGLLGAHA